MFISHIWLCVMYGAAKLHRSADNKSTILLNISCECCSNTGKTTLSSIRSLTAHNANTITALWHQYNMANIWYHIVVTNSAIIWPSWNRAYAFTSMWPVCSIYIPYCACAYVDVDVNSRMVSSILKCFQHDNHGIAAVFCCRHRFHHITSNQINSLTKYDGT